MPIRHVSFQLLHNLIYLPVRVDGHDLHFLLDTGAGASVIDVEKAKALDFRVEGASVAGSGGGEGAVAAVPIRLRELAVGEEILRDATIYAIPMPEVSRTFGAPVDGVLGYDFLSRFVVEIDYQETRVAFHPADGFRHDGPGESLPFTLEHNHIQVEADILRPGHGPLRGKFTVDVGMSVSLILNAPFVREHGLLEDAGEQSPGRIGMGVGGEARGVNGRVGGLRLGSITLDAPIAQFSVAAGGYFASAERAGNIGAEITRRFRVFVDYPGRRLILEATPAIAEPFELDMSGIRLVADGPDFRAVRVEAVAEGSPASEAGVQAGDRLVAIDDQPVAGLSLDELGRSLRRVGERRRLALRRGDAEVAAEIVLRRLY